MRIANPARPGAMRTYTPVNCDQPLLYILRFFLARALEVEAASLKVDADTIIKDVTAPVTGMLSQFFGSLVATLSKSPLVEGVMKAISGAWADVYTALMTDSAFRDAAIDFVD